MRTLVNRQVLLKARPDGIPQAAHLKIVEPAMRGWVSSVGNYSDPVPLGGVMRAFAAGQVVASRSTEYAVGDIMTGVFDWQDYAVVDASKVQRRISEPDLPISTALGALGLNGLTACFALLDIGQPRAGETVGVSTAAGAVGSCAGPIAKIKDCRAIGIAGGPRKIALCRDEFRYDVAIDHRAGNRKTRWDCLRGYSGTAWRRCHLEVRIPRFPTAKTWKSASRWP